MINIKDIKISQLKEFINSDEYKELQHIPISKLRAISNINNPRGDKDDKVLFLAYDDNRFIGYLGALPDFVFNAGKKFKVAWLSCMWIEPLYRKEGIALKLMNHANEIWESNLLITNFIPQSKAVFDKTNTYTDFLTLNGIRGYLRFNIAEILSNKKSFYKKNRFILICIDIILNLINEIRLLLWIIFKRSLKYIIEYVNEIDNELDEFIQLHSSDSLSRRQKEDFNWIIKYPWVIESSKKNNDAKRYAFSYVAKKFSYLNIKVLNEQNNIIAFLNITRHNSHLKTPYLFFKDKYINVVYDVIIKLALKLKIKTFTTYNSQLAKFIKSKPNPFILTRKMQYQSIITKNLEQKIGYYNNIKFFEGDGDGVFT